MKPNYAAKVLNSLWATVDDDGDPILKTPLDEVMKTELTGVKRTWLDSYMALMVAYAETHALDINPYFSNLSTQENIFGKTLFNTRMENYRRLCVGDFLKINFLEYIDQPRWKISEMDLKCSEWCKAAPPTIPPL